MEKLVNMAEMIFVSFICMVVSLVLLLAVFTVVYLLIDFPLVLIASISLWIFFYFLFKKNIIPL